MKTRIRTLAIAAALVPALAAPALAQQVIQESLAPRSHTRGFTLGAFLNAAAVQVEDSDAENGVGAGVHIGYGFNEHVALFARANAASISGPDEELDNYALTHVDLGVRYSFGQPAAALRPFVAGAVSGRALSFDLGSEGTLDTRGPSVTGSGGLEYFLSRSFALEATLSISYGEFNEGRIGDSGWVDLDEDALSSTTSRLDLGFTWHP